MTKIALVTGSNRGIGLSIAEKLHDDGFTVVGTYRTSAAKDAKFGRSDTFWFNWPHPELEMRKRVKNTNNFFCIVRFFIILKSN